MATIATRLGSPYAIEAFTLLLSQKPESTRITDHDVENAIHQALKANTLLRQWYFSLPNLRDQLVALAIHLFDGLLEDQFFEATDLLFDQVWSRREPSLRSLNHKQLNALDRFFFYGQTPDGEVIQTRTAGQRRQLLDIAWDPYRRYVLSALPVLIQLVRESAADQPRSWKLYGTRRRRELLRKNLGATISDIGLKSDRDKVRLDVQESLLRLAAEPSPATQAVAANAMARWREFRRERQLYLMLRIWLNDSTMGRMVQGFALGIDGSPLTDGMRNVKLTAGLAIAFAAVYDPPNKMADAALQLLTQLTQDPDLTLRIDLVRLALAQIVPLHLLQLRDMLRELAYQPTLHADIARILRETYLEQPEWVVETLRDWNGLGRAGANMDRPSRTALLTLVCIAFGRLDYSKTLGVINPSEVCDLMTTILEIEGDPAVRDAARRTAVRLPDEHQVQLQTLITRLSIDEMDSVVRELGEIYLEQRQAMRGGTGRITMSGHRYQVWSQPARRPLTPIEQRMLHWLRDPGESTHHQIARQLALRALTGSASSSRLICASRATSPTQSHLPCFVCKGRCAFSTWRPVPEISPNFHKKEIGRRSRAHLVARPLLRVSPAQHMCDYWRQLSHHLPTCCTSMGTAGLPAGVLSVGSTHFRTSPAATIGRLLRHLLSRKAISLSRMTTGASIGSLAPRSEAS